jgi:class 3 adenylate cyclase
VILSWFTHIFMNVTMWLCRLIHSITFHCDERISRCRLVCDINLRAVAASLTGRRTLVEVGMQVVPDLVQCLHRPPVLRLLLGYLGDGSLAVFSIASRSVACNLSVQLVVRERILVRNFIADCHRIGRHIGGVVFRPQAN